MIRNKKAQSFTELAIFGSVLLMVLSFFVSLGMRLNYQHQLQLKVFRMALSQAYNQAETPDATAAIQRIETKHIPDPQDLVGLGSFTPVASGADVTWGVSMMDPYVDDGDDSEMPKLYNQIDDAPLPAEVADGLTTQTIAWITSDTYANFFVQVPPRLDTDGTVDGQMLKTWAEVRCYIAPDTTAKRARVLLSGTETYVVQTINVDLDNDGVIRREEESLPVIGIRPTDANDGDPVTGFEVLIPQNAEINPYYQDPGYIKQYGKDLDGDGLPDLNQQQGVIFPPKIETARDRSLAATETANPGGAYTSTAQYDASGSRVTYELKTNASDYHIVISPTKRGVFTWTTSPK